MILLKVIISWKSHIKSFLTNKSQAIKTTSKTGSKQFDLSYYNQEDTLSAGVLGIVYCSPFLSAWWRLGSGLEVDGSGPGPTLRAPPPLDLSDWQLSIVVNHQRLLPSAQPLVVVLRAIQPGATLSDGMTNYFSLASLYTHTHARRHTHKKQTVVQTDQSFQKTQHLSICVITWGLELYLHVNLCIIGSFKGSKWCNIRFYFFFF